MIVFRLGVSSLSRHPLVLDPASELNRPDSESVGTLPPPKIPEPPSPIPRPTTGGTGLMLILEVGCARVNTDPKESIRPLNQPAKVGLMPNEA